MENALPRPSTLATESDGQHDLRARIRRNRPEFNCFRKRLSQSLRQFGTEDYLAVLNLDGAVALELAHDLRDRFAGRGDHVRHVLVRKAYAEERTHPVGFTEAFT